jgi:hypothetical protein
LDYKPLIIRQKIHEAIVRVVSWELKMRNASYNLRVVGFKVLIEESESRQPV